MLSINPKKFKYIQNKSIPNPLRPKFRNNNKSNIYFLSKRRFDNKKKELVIKNLKVVISILIVGISGYFLAS
ncbi:hypothetical protein OAW36_00740 [Pelagibacteraceae bacterium]|jgi:hypothetical protein|nr:hypothetical protein [Pelagibacteraceae bacterium]